MKAQVMALECRFTHLMVDGGHGKVTFRGQSRSTLSQVCIEVICAAVIQKKSRWEVESLAEGEVFSCEIPLFPRLRASLERTHPISVRVSATDVDGAAFEIEGELFPWKQMGVFVLPSGLRLSEVRELFGVGSTQPLHRRTQPMQHGATDAIVEDTGGEFPDTWTEVILKDIQPKADVSPATQKTKIDLVRADHRKPGVSGQVDTHPPSSDLTWDTEEGPLEPNPQAADQPSSSDQTKSTYRTPPGHREPKTTQKTPSSQPSQPGLNRAQPPVTRRPVVPLVDQESLTSAVDQRAEERSRVSQVEPLVFRRQSSRSGRKWLLRVMGVICTGAALVIGWEFFGHRFTANSDSSVSQAPTAEIASIEKDLDQGFLTFARKKLTALEEKYPSNVEIQALRKKILAAETGGPFPSSPSYQEFNNGYLLLREHLEKALKMEPLSAAEASFSAAELTAAGLLQTISKLTAEEKKMASTQIPSQYEGDPSRWVQGSRAKVLAAADAIASAEFLLQGGKPDLKALGEAKTHLLNAQQELPTRGSIQQTLATLQAKIEMETKAADSVRLTTGLEKIDASAKAIDAGALTAARALYSQAQQLLAPEFPALLALEKKLKDAETLATSREMAREKKVRDLIDAYYKDPAEVAQHFTDPTIYRGVKVSTSDLDKDVRKYAEGLSTELVSLSIVELKSTSQGFDIKTEVVINAKRTDPVAKTHRHQQIQYKDSFSIVEEFGEFKIARIRQDFHRVVEDTLKREEASL